MNREISPQILRKYVETWRKIDAEIDTIHSLASLLALLQHSTDDRLMVEAHSLSHVFQLIDRSVLRICSILDDFIGVGEARATLAKLEQSQNRNTQT